MTKMQKQFDRCRDKCVDYYNALVLRKHQIRQYNLFIDKLISEGRITRDEISQYMNKKSEVKKSKKLD